MFDALKFLRDYAIEHVQEGHKHCRPGWVQTPCPFCTGNPGYHLGFCFDSGSKFAGAFVCWRCGGKSTVRVIQKLLGCSWDKARMVAVQYKGRAGKRIKRERTVIPKVPRSISGLPDGVDEITRWPGAAKYVLSRGYTPEYLSETWGVRASGPGGSVFRYGDYAYRLIIPISLRGRIVSYHSRDYTKKQSVPHKACPVEIETVHHKNIVGGFDQAMATETGAGVFVEGFFDAFRLGPGACPLFGIKYRLPQIQFIAKHFRRAVVLFDGGEIQARRQSEKICTELAHRGVEVHEAILTGGDPDEVMDADEAREFMSKWLDS